MFIQDAFFSFFPKQILLEEILSKKVTHSVPLPPMTSLRNIQRMTHLPQTHSRKTLPYLQRWVMWEGEVPVCTLCLWRQLVFVFPYGLNWDSVLWTMLTKPDDCGQCEARWFSSSQVMDGRVAVPMDPCEDHPVNHGITYQWSREPKSGGSSVLNSCHSSVPFGTPLLQLRTVFWVLCSVSAPSAALSPKKDKTKQSNTHFHTPVWPPREDPCCIPSAQHC